jgi:SAM-dependent methyltransferase
MGAFQDHFASAADSYQANRPRYPPPLFDFLAEASPRRETAWDCATGSGQAAEELEHRFAHVVATDASLGQLARAPRPSTIRFAAAAAEAAPLRAACTDLVTVAQALHWFRLETFYAEVRRVLRPRGLFAVWTYDLLNVTPAVDREVRHFHDEVVGLYWPDPRQYVNTRYAALPFPFERLAVPELSMTARWSVDRLLGYIASWSAVAHFRKAHGVDPVAELEPRLRRAWGGAQERVARWPLTVLATRLP